MKLSVTEEAADWYIEELGLDAGDNVQFFIKLYGGIPTPHSDYFLGISVEDGGNAQLKDEVKGITFYFNESDSWFLDEYNLKVEMGQDEVEYVFTKI